MACSLFGEVIAAEVVAEVAAEVAAASVAAVAVAGSAVVWAFSAPLALTKCQQCVSARNPTLMEGNQAESVATQPNRCARSRPYRMRYRRVPASCSFWRVMPSVHPFQVEDGIATWVCQPGSARCEACAAEILGRNVTPVHVGQQPAIIIRVSCLVFSGAYSDAILHSV